MNKPSSTNVYLFYGEDDFSIKRKIDFWREEFAKKHSGSDIVFFEGEKFAETDLLKNLEESLSPSLFSSKKLIIVRNCLPTKASQESLADGLDSIIERIPADYFLVFWQTEKLDMRLKVTKKIMGLPIKATEFKLPHDVMLNQWLMAEAKIRGAEIDQAAADKLAVFLGRDLAEEKKAGGRVVETKEVYNLWQASNELEKLISHSERIKPADVESLVKPRLPDNVFAFSDFIINKQEQKAFTALEQLLSATGADEKSSIIKIVGLLTEQLRSLTLVSLLSSKKKSQEEMAEILGWTPGRVFVNLKLARNFDIEKAKKLLGSLLQIDKKLKTSESDPKLLIDLFIHQACT